MNAADIAVFDRHDQLSVLVEVRPRKESSQAWASEIRREVIEMHDGFIPRYFLVVARDSMYLWKSAKAPHSPPDLEVPTEEILSSYLEPIERTVASVAPSVLELVVGNWLDDLTRGTERHAAASLDDAGLRDAVSNGRIHFPRAA